MDEYRDFIDWALKGLLAGGVVYSANALSNMKDSVSKLNENIATILERMSWHEKEINDHGERITNLESPKRLRKRGGE